MNDLVLNFPGIPLIHQPFFDKLWDFKAHDDTTNELAVTLNRDGFATIDFPEPDFTALADRLIATLAPRYDFDAWRKDQLTPMRIQDLWAEQPDVRRLAANQHINDLLTKLYGRRAIPFQTLNFAVGTQQAAHSDHVHFHTLPEKFMCGVWIALEDTDETNGALFYYPGSQDWLVLRNEHIGVNVAHNPPDNSHAHYMRFPEAWIAMAELYGIKPKRACLKKGQAVIWTATVVHGGSPIVDTSRTRWSQVTHYVFENCTYTTPMSNNEALRHLTYRDIIDISTGQPVPHMCCGDVVNKNPTQPAATDYLKAQRMY